MFTETDKERQVVRASIAATEAAKQLLAPVAAAYFWRGFPGDDPTLLLLGLVEEVGELAELVNISSRPKYHVSERKAVLLENLHENIAAELGDILTYAAALATHYGVVPDFYQWAKWRAPQTE